MTPPPYVCINVVVYTPGYQLARVSVSVQICIGVSVYHTPTKTLFLIHLILFTSLQGDQLNMAVFFWCIGSYLFGVYVYSRVHWTSHFLQGLGTLQKCKI